MSPTSVVSCFLITVLAGAALGDAVKDIAKVKLRARRNLVDTEPLLYYLSVDTGKAYMASNRKETWDSAKDMCLNMHGGRLAHIESEAESKYLAKKFRIDDAEVFWLGLVKEGKYGGLFWEDASQWDGYDWGSGKEMRAPVEPPFDDPRKMKDETPRAPTDSCYALYPDQPNLSEKIVATWIELPCNERHYFICEVEWKAPVTFLPEPLATELPQPTPLSDDELRKYYYDLDKENGGGGDWAYFKDLGKRYKLFHIKMTFDEAKKACKLLGERILNIEYIMWGREVAFLSGKFMSKDEPEYWMFREALSDRDPSTSYCDVFVPSKKMSKNNYKTLSKDQCNEKKYFICEKVDRVQIGG